MELKEFHAEVAGLSGLPFDVGNENLPESKEELESLANDVFLYFLQNI